MSIFYNAFHSPIGSHSSFTLGCLGQNGGLGLELGCPANENIYIGVEDKAGGTFKALPFFSGTESDAARYDHDKKSGKKEVVAPYALNKIKRDFNMGTDQWTADDLSFTVYSPVCSVPDPDKAKAAELKSILCPAVLAELTIDNTKGKKERKAFFGYQPENSSDATLREGCGKGTAGVSKGQATAIYTDAKGAVSGSGCTAEDIWTVREENYTFALGRTALILLKVPAGKKVTYKFAN